jgi:hypothetical protein
MTAVSVVTDVPDGAMWPRLVTGRHPRRAGSLGAEVEAWASERPRLNPRGDGGLRWWQRLVLDRAFEHDSAGRLVWNTVVLSAPRQVGKSWLERLVLAWRLHQRDRFGEEQTGLHVAHKLLAAQEVWRPAARWASGVYGKGAVRWANGEQQIELPDGSRWLIQAATDGAGVAFSLSTALVDEAWRVPREVVDGAIMPTMAEAEQPQLWLVSTAGTSQSDLMLTYRALGLALEQPGERDGLLLVEWSAPPDPDLDIDDPGVWRLASPYWDARRLERVADARGKVSERVFRQQWLNQWVPTVSEPLFDPDVWGECRWEGRLPAGPVALGADVAGDRSHAAIVACSGRVVQVVDERDGAAWVPARLVELGEAFEVTAVGVDGSGPAATVADQLAGTELGARLVVLTGRHLAAACGRMFDAVCDGTVAAVPDDRLDGAVFNAAKRVYGQSWVFARHANGVSGVPLLAATVAAWAADHVPAPVEMSAIW